MSAKRTIDEKRRRASRRRSRGRLRLVLVRSVLNLIPLLPLRFASRLGDAGGRLLFHLLRDRRRRALRNLELALGDRMGEARRQEVALASFRLLGACAVEWVVLSGRGRQAAIDTVVRVDGWENVTSALARGRGVVIVTAHFGLFELLSSYFAHRGVPGKVVGRRPASEGFEALITENRKRMGLETVPQQRAREIFRVLREGGIVGTLPDQDVDKLNGAFVPFFGRPAYTATGPAMLSVMNRAPLVPLFIYRLGPGRHRIAVHPPVPDRGENREERILSLTESLNRVFEEAIAASPEHWAWIHERWSTTPESLERRRARRAARAAKRTRRRLAASSSESTDHQEPP